jgi:hypothetical protein
MVYINMSDNNEKLNDVTNVEELATDSNEDVIKELTEDQALSLLQAIFGGSGRGAQELANEGKDVEFTVAEIKDHRTVCGAIHMVVVAETTTDREEAFDALLALQAENPGVNYVLASRNAR